MKNLSRNYIEKSTRNILLQPFLIDNFTTKANIELIMIITRINFLHCQP